jgi:hypothetical protein
MASGAAGSIKVAASAMRAGQQAPRVHSLIFMESVLQIPRSGKNEAGILPLKCGLMTIFFRIYGYTWAEAPKRAF